MTPAGIAILTTTGTVLAAVLSGGWRRNRKLEQIHVLVNSRLSLALQEITALKQLLSEERGEEVGNVGEEVVRALENPNRPQQKAGSPDALRDP